MQIGRLASLYRWIEYLAFGRTLERQRFAFLDRLRYARRILVLGEGDGRALARMLECAPGAVVDVVELSGEMVALARDRVPDARRVRFVVADAREMEWPANEYDAAVTFFFLDCLAEGEARAVAARVAFGLRPGGIWLMSDFCVPDAGWRRWHAQIWIGAMYQFFRITTGLRVRKIPPIADVLRGVGMSRVGRTTERAGMVVAEVWEKRLADRS